MNHSKIITEEAKPVQIFLGLGSNIGDRRHNLESALAALALKIKVQVVSSMYDTNPVGNSLQPRFLNLHGKPQDRDQFLLYRRMELNFSLIFLLFIE